MSGKSNLSRVAVASHSISVQSLVGRLARTGGLSVAVIEPTEGSIANAIQSSVPVVILDVLNRDADWLLLARAILARCPGAKLVVLGGPPELAVVSKAVAIGISHYLLDVTPPVTFVNALKDVHADKPPSTDTMFGRVWSELPCAADREGMCRTQSGKSYSLKEAIKRCDQFGLSPEEIATRLRVSTVDLAAVLQESRIGPRASPFSPFRLPKISPSVGEQAVGSRSRPMAFAVLAMLAVSWCVVSIRSTTPSQNSFISVSGTLGYEDGKDFGTPTSLMFGLLSPEGKGPPSYSGVAEVDGRTGAFSTVLRLSHKDHPPYTFRIAVLDKSLSPLDSSVVATKYATLATTPLSLTTSGEAIHVRCPKPR